MYISETDIKSFYELAFLKLFAFCILGDKKYISILGSLGLRIKLVSIGIFPSGIIKSKKSLEVKAI